MAASPATSIQPLLFHSSSSSPTPSSSSLTFPSKPTSQAFLSLHKSHPHSLTFLHPHHSFSPPSTPPPHAIDSSLPRTGPPFLDQKAIERLQKLDKFEFTHEFDHGWLQIRHMEDDELSPTAQLLAESFSETMWVPAGSIPLLAFLVKQYVIERRNLVPHSAVLVGFYKEKGGVLEEAQLACTAEVSFDALGANPSAPTPVSPQDYPYICNMTVRKTLRRRGIGWNLLKACEDLISRMNTKRRVYLHCRVVDRGPYHMYKKAGYKIAKTDSILVWLSFQRRKYLMWKELQGSDNSQLEVSRDDHPG